MNIAIVLGTRPEIIKMSPLIDMINKSDDKLILIHTGQHYDNEMSKQFFTQLNLPLPDYNIGIGSQTAIKQISIIIAELEEILVKEEADIVLVQGDTNAVLAGALAANKLKIPVGHVEAGLRSFDKNMPEETNRIIADSCSNLFFVPTPETAINLQNEGVNHKNIYVTGNTIVDACIRNLDIAIKKSEVKDIIKFDKYIALTLHRAENVDDFGRLEQIVNSLVNIDYNIVLPLHPHTKKSLSEAGLYDKIIECDHIQITKPLSYLDFLYLLSQSSMILTDSGGVQEEAITLNIPCVTLRYNTERPETITAGGNILAGTNQDEIENNINNILNNKDVYDKMTAAENPYGDGTSSEFIYDIIRKTYEDDSVRIKSTSAITDFEGYYLENITDDITVSDFESMREHHIIEQIFNDGKPEYICDDTPLKGKAVVVKNFKKM